MLVSAGNAFSQSDFRPGYIINNNSDTIRGTIDYRGDLLMGSLCRFKGSDGTVKEYLPTDIKSYRFTDSKFYISKQVKSKYVFLEYLVNGKLRVYYLRDENGDHYFIENDSLAIIEVPYEEKILEKDGKRVLFTSSKHIGLLGMYTKDAPQFQASIKNISKPTAENISNLAEKYHYAVCNDQQCIIYNKKTPVFRVMPELLVGVTKYNGVYFLKDGFLPQFGFIAHIWMPTVSEKLYLRTGIFVSELPYIGNYASDMMFKFPIQVEYMYPKGNIRPRIFYGININNLVYKNTVSVGGGLSVKLYKIINWNTTAEAEFDSPALIIPRNLFTYSFNTGIMLKFK